MNLYEVQEYYWTFRSLFSILRVVTISLNLQAATAALQDRARQSFLTVAVRLYGRWIKMPVHGKANKLARLIPQRVYCFSENLNLQRKAHHI